MRRQETALQETALPVWPCCLPGKSKWKRKGKRWRVGWRALPLCRCLPWCSSDCALAGLDVLPCCSRPYRHIRGNDDIDAQAAHVPLGLFCYIFSAFLGLLQTYVVASANLASGLVLFVGCGVPFAALMALLWCALWVASH